MQVRKHLHAYVHKVLIVPTFIEDYLEIYVTFYWCINFNPLLLLPKIYPKHLTCGK